MFYPSDVLPIFAQNANAGRENHQMLQSISDDWRTITAINQFRKNISNQKIIKVLNRNQSETGGLAPTLEIRLG